MVEKGNKKVIVCIPAYNVSRVIRQIVTDCLQFADDVIVCDDGSIDNTASEAMVGGATVISHAKNSGKGAALKTLFNIARYIKPDVTITMDGDGQFLPMDIDKLAKPILDGKSDVVIGYRFDGDNKIPSYRKFGNKILDRISNMASDLPVRDTQSGFRAYSSNAISSIVFESDRFGADTEILVDATRKGLKISEEKVTVLYDTGEKTSTKNPVSHTSEVVHCILDLIALRRPLRFLGVPGIGMMLIGLLFSILTISLFNHERYFSIPMTLISLGFFVVGIMLILMSVVLFSIGRAMRRGY